MKRWRRLLWISLATVISLPLLIVLIGYSLLASQAGSAWVLEQVAGQLRNQQIVLQYQSFSGTLLDQIKLSGLSVTLPPAEGSSEKQLVEIDHLQFAWQPSRLLDRELHIKNISVQTLFLKLPAGNQDAAAAPPEIPELVLPVDVRLDRFELTDLLLDDRDTAPVVRQFSLSAGFKQSVLALDGLLLVVEQGRVSGDLSATLDASQALAGQLKADLELPEIGALRSTLKLDGRLLNPQLRLDLQQPFQAGLTAQINLQQATPEMSGGLKWQSLQWPIQDEADLVADAGQLNFSGTPDNYRLALKARLSGPAIPETLIDLSGQGNTTAIELQPLLVNTLEGRLSINGSVDWQQDPRWDVGVVFEDINPGLLAAEWPGKLAGQLHAAGGIVNAAAVGEVRIDDLQGTLRDYPVTMLGVIRHADKSVKTDNLQLRMGDNNVVVQGGVSDSLNLDLDIDAPDLSHFYPGLAGTLKGKARLTGSLDQPGLDADLAGQALQFEEHSVASLSLKGQLNQQHADLLLKADKLSLSGNPLDALQAHVTGSLSAHHIVSSLQSPRAAVELVLDGVQGQDWQGKLTTLNIKNDWLDWQLQQTARIRAGASGYSLTDLCLQGKQESLCANASLQAQDKMLKTRVDLKNLSLDKFRPLLPEQMSVEGMVDGHLLASGPLDALQAELLVQPSDGLFKFSGLEEPFELGYRNVLIKANYANDRTTAKLTFNLGENGEASGDLKIGAGPERKLAGQLRASFPDLQLIRGFVPDLSELQGAMAMNLKIAGKLDDPRLDGRVSISEAEAVVPAAGIELKAINLSLAADGQKHLKLDASARSGEGQISMTGLVDATVFPASLDIVLTGDNFQVARLPEALVTVSPDLTLKGSEILSLTGSLDIPQAKIEVYELPQSVVSVSRDEVIVGQAPPEKPARNIQADVKLRLGKDVSFRGFGLQTGLEGFLDAVYDGSAAQLFGRILMVNGLYAAYGQKLEIEKGRLLFAGPTDNAGVDLRAKRVSIDKEVTAYLTVTGQLSNPKVKVSSAPALPEAEALAYLVTGRNLNSANKKAGNEITSAALALGLSKTLPALNEMGDRLGLDELNVDAGDGNYEEASLAVGKYLNPDLYIGYVHGLFDASGAIKLNYRFTERIELESLSGDDSESVDIYYKYEHD